MAAPVKVTEYQTRVYTLLQQIPEGRVSTYAALSKALGSSPRAVGGALRRNPYAPRVPCHRIISADGVSDCVISEQDKRLCLTISQYVGGFKGEWQKAPSGVNQTMKLELLEKEGVKFDTSGKLLDGRLMWAGFEV